MSELIREFWRIIVGENPEVKQALEEEGVALLVEEIERKDDTYTISIANTTMTNIERILYDAINKPLSSVEKGIRNANRVIEQTRALTKREEIPELTPELAVLLYE
ncbi:MAG: hypothetical protein RMI04_09385, partial [Thermofilaceae archaeon]|nr:hypothetical protein [Thermofilaceae archaeon]